MNVDTKRPFAALVAFAVLGTLSACATGPVFESAGVPKSGNALVYVYRTSTMAGGGMSHRVRIDSASEVSLPNGSWRELSLSPGAHTVEIQDYLGLMRCGPSPLLFEAKADQVIFIENSVRMVSYTPPVVQTGCLVRVISRDEALQALKSLRQAG